MAPASGRTAEDLAVADVQLMWCTEHLISLECRTPNNASVYWPTTHLGVGPRGYIKANIILQLKRKKPQHELDCLTKRKKTTAALVLSICQNDHWPLPDTFLVQVLQYYYFISRLKSKVQRGLLSVNPWQHLHLQLSREAAGTALNWSYQHYAP